MPRHREPAWTFCFWAWKTIPRCPKCDSIHIRCFQNGSGAATVRFGAFSYLYWNYNGKALQKQRSDKMKAPEGFPKISKNVTWPRSWWLNHSWGSGRRAMPLKIDRAEKSFWNWFLLAVLQVESLVRAKSNQFSEVIHFARYDRVRSESSFRAFLWVSAKFGIWIRNPVFHAVLKPYKEFKVHDYK